MVDSVLAIPESVFLPILNSSQVFPVRRVFCVGQNYSEHAREMGADPERQPPFFFSKPAQAVYGGPQFPYPPLSHNVQPEVELVLALAGPAQIWGYGVGLDMTRRDLQAQAKQLGRPWDAAKGFAHSAPCSQLIRLEQSWRQLQDFEIRLSVNGQLRQSGRVSSMIWQIPEILQHLGALFELAAGDLVFTGTPAGVAPIVPGDRLLAELVGQVKLELLVGPKPE